MPLLIGFKVTYRMSRASGLRLEVDAWAVRPWKRNMFDAASHGGVDALISLGPTYVKLGQIIASSPGLFPQPLASAAQRCLDEVPPFPSETARRIVCEDLGRPVSQMDHVNFG